jgi:hypothetical protein
VIVTLDIVDSLLLALASDDPDCDADDSTDSDRLAVFTTASLIEIDAR